MIPALVYVLTAVVVVVVVVTRLRISAAHSITRAKLGRVIPLLHTVGGGLGLVLWVLYLVVGEALPLYLVVGIIGLGGIWVAGFSGLVMLARWMPSKGRHADEPDHARWRMWVSALGHVLVVVAGVLCTYAYMFALV